MVTEREWEALEDFEVRAKPKDLTYSVKHKTLGPAHDPYARMTMTVSSRGHSIMFQQCALAGTRLWINGVAISDLDSNSWSEKDWDALMETWFEALTGVRVEDVLFWELERSAELAQVAMAELRAGWDRNP